VAIPKSPPVLLFPHYHLSPPSTNPCLDSHPTAHRISSSARSVYAANHSAHRSSPAGARRVTHLAVQFRLGLLSQRRPRFTAGHPYRPRRREKDLSFVPQPRGNRRYRMNIGCFAGGQLPGPSRITPCFSTSNFSKFLETKSTYPSSIVVYARPVPEVSREPQSVCPEGRFTLSRSASNAPDSPPRSKSPDVGCRHLRYLR